MKKCIASLICLLAVLYVSTAHAQVSISIRQPLSYQLKVTDLFNADLINTSGQPIRIYLKGAIQNMQTKQVVVEAKSAELDLPQGAKTISSNSVNPSYQYYGDAGNVSATGQLPYGNYQLCLKAYSLPDNEEVGDACITTEISPLSPPLLLSPDNASEVSMKNPLLVWLPPTPVNKDMKVVYDLKLVELMPNQTAYDAIQRNFALLDQKDIRTTNLQYPANAIALEEGKTYAWQITARTENYLIGQTEVWTFKYAKPASQESDDIAVSDNYIIPKKNREGGNLYIGKTLKVFSSGFPDNMTPEYEIRNVNNQLVTTDDISVTLEGNGKMIFNLSGCSQLKHRQYYYLVLITPHGDKGYIGFQYIKKK